MFKNESYSGDSAKIANHLYTMIKKIAEVSKMNLTETHGYENGQRYETNIVEFSFGQDSLSSSLYDDFLINKKFLAKLNIETTKDNNYKFDESGYHDTKVLLNFIKRLDKKNIATALKEVVLYLKEEGFLVHKKNNLVLNKKKNIVCISMSKGSQITITITVESKVNG